MSAKRIFRYLYRPDKLEREDGVCLVDDEDELSGAEVSRAQHRRIFEHGNKKKNNARVRSHLAGCFKKDPCSFFQEWDMDRVVHSSREQWVEDPEYVAAINISVQFVLYMDNQSVRNTGRGSSRQNPVRYKRPSQSDVLEAADKNETFYFERVAICARRQRQFSGRQHSKARTFIDCIVEVYNYDRSKGLTPEMVQEINEAKRSEQRSGIADNQMIGIIKMVVNSILAGERKYFLVVYRMLLGEIGAKCAPRTHAYLTEFIGHFERLALNSRSIEVSDRDGKSVDNSDECSDDESASSSEDEA
jgi:hypothetical protein